MKIAVVTWTSYPNYGTVLQAYALQQAINQLGYENEILSDEEVLRVFRREHPYESAEKQADDAQQQSRIQRVFALLRRPGRLLRAVRRRIDPEGFAAPYERSQKAVSDFVAEALCLRLDVRPEDLDRLNGDYDVFLCGSDQIWSVRPVNFNPYYFLKFVKKPKFSYAPSLGTDQIPSEKGAEIALLLKDFTAVSVRESRSAEQLSELLQREVAWVSDPTLLHDRAFWEAFCQSVPKRGRRYLLCYFLEDREWYFHYAQTLAKEMRLTLRLLPNRWEHLIRDCVEKKTVGPREFVAYFRDAAYILTDSYHGSIFSLLFEKDFQYLQRFRADDPGSQNIRVTSLFNRLGLQDRIVKQDVGAKPSYKIPEYDKIKQKTVQFRASSKQYLETSFGSVKHIMPD